MSELKITGLEVRSFTIPYDQPIGSALGIYSGADWVIVTLNTDQGLSGTGFTMSLDPKGSAAVRAFLETDLAEMVQGQDALAPEALWKKLWSPLKARMRAGIGFQALSAIDIACWDVAAKAADRPLHGLLGGHRKKVPVYGSGGWVTLDDRQLLAECQAFAELGIPAYKLKIGRADDRDRVGLLRREMGDDYTLFVDANQGMNVRQAIEASRWLADLGVAWFEEPVIADSIDDLAAVARQSAVPVAAGENAYARWGFREICERRAATYLQPDVVRCGGVTEFMRIADLADAHKLALTSHLVHELHVSLVGAHRAGHLVEYMDFMPDGALIREFGVEDGYMTVPDVSGHGVEFDFERLAAYAN